MMDVLEIVTVIAIDKLRGILSKVFGKSLKLYFDKKDIDTEAYKIEKLAEANAKAAVKTIETVVPVINKHAHLTGGMEFKDDKISISSPKELSSEISKTIPIDSSLEERTQERLNFQEVKKQRNIENVTAFAAEELKNEPPVTDEPLDEDWVTRFFTIVADISNEQMQALWGKILAGEVKQPKTYSLRTLEILRNLSKNEADVFKKVANFAVKNNNKSYLFKGKDTKLLKKEHNISYSDTALLIEVGLLLPGESIQIQLLQNSTDIQKVFTAGKIVFIVTIKANTPTIEMPVYVFTNAGNELLKLIAAEPPMDYLTSVANSIKNENVEVKYAHILAFEGDNIRHTPLQDF